MKPDNSQIEKASEQPVEKRKAGRPRFSYRFKFFPIQQYKKLQARAKALTDLRRSIYEAVKNDISLADEIQETEARLKDLLKRAEQGELE